MAFSKPEISKKEWKIAGIIALFVVLITQLPLIIGYMTEKPGEVFMGIPVHVTDANNHLHLILQAKEGAWLFTNRFTPEEVPALLFNPYHLVLGNFARFTDMSVVNTYNLFGILISFGFIAVLYWFISHFVADKKTRMVGFILALTASGFGYWWRIVKWMTAYSFDTVDLWITEMTIFQSFSQPHFILSLLLLLSVFIFGLKAFENADWKSTIYAGLLGLLLSLIHIFEAVTIALVLSGWFVFRQVKARKLSMQEFKALVTVGLFMLPGVAYYAWVFLLNPAYAEWNAANETITPNLFRIVSGFGIVLFLTVYYIWAERKQLLWGKKTTAVDFLIIWTIISLGLIYIPINVQRRFLLGLQVPLCILAAIILVNYELPVIGKASKSTWFIVAVIALASVTNIYKFNGWIVGLHDDYVGEYGNVKYLSASEYDALMWLDQNTNNDDVVLAPYKLGNYIPAVTGNKVYVGHWAQTIDFQQKYNNAKRIYSTGTFIDQIQFQYLVWPISNGQYPELDVAYQNAGFVIMKK